MPHDFQATASTMSDMLVCLSVEDEDGLGHAPPKFLRKESRCTEIASEAILGPKQSHSCYIHSLQSIASNVWLSMYAFAKPVDSEFLQENS